MSQITFIVVDNDQTNALKTKSVADSFQNLECIGIAHNYDEALDIIIAKNPKIIFLEINTDDKKSDLNFNLINELYRYLIAIPTIIVTSKDKQNAYEAIKHGVFDYLVQPIEQKDLRKSLSLLLKNNKSHQSSDINNVELHLSQQDLTSKPIVALDEIDTQDYEVEELLDESVVVKTHEKINNENSSNGETTFININSKVKPLIICVKSYGDYRYINSDDICFLQADNNSTDIHLKNLEMITAFKTLKHFEAVLKYPFVRIHNSYIVNVDYISRIHTGNAVCHIKETTTKLPFSKSYKENVDFIINTISSGNYLEI